MTSFQRQLNLYGFRRVTKGEDVGSYYHPKFQKGRRDLVPEIKRLPGKTSGYGHDDKSKSSLLPHFSTEHRFNPADGNIVEVMGNNNRPITMSKLTMKIAGINSSDVSTLPPQIVSPNVPPPVLTPAYVAENAIQFIYVKPNNNINNNINNNNNSNSPIATSPTSLTSKLKYIDNKNNINVNNNNNNINMNYNNNNNNQNLTSKLTSNLTNVPQLTTVCLTREIEQNPPPLLLRNFSVSSSFDEEYRLPAPNEEDIPTSTTSNSSSCNSTNQSSVPSSLNETTNQNEPNVALSRSSSLIDFMSKPQTILRDESESWVKLGALDQLHDMDPFDIDTVFE